MPVTVRIPTQLRLLAGGNSEVWPSTSTVSVAEALTALDVAHPGFNDRLFDEAGKLRRFVNVFVADEDIRFLDGIETPVADGATVSIVRRPVGRAPPPPPPRWLDGSQCSRGGLRIGLLEPTEESSPRATLPSKGACSRAESPPPPPCRHLSPARSTDPKLGCTKSPEAVNC